jgi:hypothetical protein
MKKILLCLFTSFLVNDFTHAQIKVDSPLVKKFEDEQKSFIVGKEERTIGWILIGTGFALSAIIFAMVRNNKGSNEEK